MVNISGERSTPVSCVLWEPGEYSGGTFQRHFFSEKGSRRQHLGGLAGLSRGALGGSVINIDGWKVGGAYFFVVDGSVVNLSGGSIGDDFWLYGGALNMSADRLGQRRCGLWTSA